MTDGTKLTSSYAAIGIGAVLALGGIIWGSFIGYYEHQSGLLMGMLILGVVLMFFGQRTLQSTKRRQVEQRIAQRMSQEK